MKIIDWIRDGKVRTAAGHDVEVWLTDSDEYPLEGVVKASPQFECRWDENGYPWNLPTTHGLQLVAVVPEVSYRVLSRSELEQWDEI